MKKIAGIVLFSSLAMVPPAFSAPEGTLSVHILNQQTGLPPADVMVTLEQQQESGWVALANAKTDNDGRIKSLFPMDQDMQPGVYRVTFKTYDYFQANKLDSFFPEIPVLFKVSRTNEKLHIPLLLSQFGYSTYKGS